MATKKKVENSEEIKKEEVKTTEEIPQEAQKQELPKEEKPVENKKSAQKTEKEPKYAVGSVVFIHKEADADLNGFKLFPQYKKYTYTVEAYDAKSEVYSLRRLNLSLRLKEADIMAPHEKSGSALISKQY